MEIVERRRSNDSSQKGEASFRAIFVRASVGIALIDRDGYTIESNPALQRMLGYSSDELRGMAFYDFTHPEDIEPDATLFRDMLTGRSEHYQIEKRYFRKGGELMWGRLSVSLLREMEDGPAFGVAILEDITERKHAEQLQRESEVRFRLVADSAPVLIWMSGADKRCTYFNRRWLEFTGRTLEQELGDGWTEGAHPEDMQRCVNAYVRAFDARKPFTMEYRLRRHDGEYRWVTDSGVPQFGADGSFSGYIGSCIDITEHKRAEEEHLLLAAVVESSNDAIFSLTTARTVRTWNPAAEKLFGYSAAEIVGWDISLLFPPERREEASAVFEKVRAGLSVNRLETICLHKDGALIEVSLNVAPIQNEQGQVTGASAVVRDITERREADRLVQRERAFLRQVIDIAPNLIFAKDRQGRFTLVNQAIADIYGTTVDDLIGKTDADFNRNIEEVEMFRRMDLEVMDTLQERFISEEHVTDAAGKVRWLQTVKRPILEEDGTANQVLGSSTDITARKRAELELAQQRNELAHLARVTMMGEMTSSLAHELNQPLTAILSNAETAMRLLKDPAPDITELREILDDILSDDQRAGEIIRNLRSLLKKSELDFRPLDLNSVILEVIGLIRSDALIKNVPVASRLAPDLPPVRGDRIQLHQVMLNLAINALDAMRDVPASERRLNIATTQVDAHTVQVAVQDAGTGIPPEQLDKVFDPFFTNKPHGLGIGLSICRSIAHMHGGRIWAANNADRGVTFRFILPIKEDSIS